MKDTELTVVTALKKRYFEPEITKQDFPQGVKGTLKKSVGGFDNNSSGAVLLISDNLNHIKEFIN